MNLRKLLLIIYIVSRSYHLTVLIVLLFYLYRRRIENFDFILTIEYLISRLFGAYNLYLEYMILLSIIWCLHLLILRFEAWLSLVVSFSLGLVQNNFHMSLQGLLANVVPLGLQNAPITFQHIINMVFFDVLNTYVMIYLDNLSIFTKSVEKHQKLLDTVFDHLAKQQLYLRPEKCELLLKHWNSLGIFWIFQE